MWPLEKREDLHYVAHIDSHKPFHLSPLAYFILIVKGIELPLLKLICMQEEYEMKGEVRTLLCIKHTNLTDLMYLCHHGSAQTTSWQVQLKSKTSVELLTSTNIILNGLSITEGGRKSSQLMVDDIKLRLDDFAPDARHSTFCFCSTSILLYSLCTPTIPSAWVSVSQHAMLNANVLPTAACKIYWYLEVIAYNFKFSSCQTSCCHFRPLN